MKKTRKNTIGLAGCASTAFLFSTIANAGTVVVTGAYTGTNGAPSSNGSINQEGILAGNSGGDGYDATDSSSTYTFNNPTIVGGSGGSVTSGSAIGGFGGNGLLVYGPTQTTFNGGSYTGGRGGSQSGGGQGPSSPAVVIDSGSTTVNGGTFNGADGVPGQRAGSDGFDFGGTVLTILGGNFTGGVGSAYGYAGIALTVSGTTNIYGGTFNTPSSGFAGLEGFGGTTNVYGSNFAINGVPVGPGLTTLSSGTLTGLLQDNSSPTSISFSGGQLNLVTPVPEPAAVSLIVSGAAMGLSRRRRTK